MTDGPIVTMKKNAKGEEIHFLLDRFNGHQIFNARVFYDDGHGVMRPTKQGVAFKVDMLPEFAEAVQKALAEAKRRGLVK